jgi:hypothetical protein
MILPPGGEWVVVRPAIDDAADAVTTALGEHYRAVALTDQLTALIGDPDDVAETNPYLPGIGSLYGVRLRGRGPAVFTGGLVRVGTQQRVMPLPAAHAVRIRELVEALKSRMLTIRPLHHE